jgi:hypothetical protein
MLIIAPIQTNRPPPTTKPVSDQNFPLKVLLNMALSLCVDLEIVHWASFGSDGCHEMARSAALDRRGVCIV